MKAADIENGRWYVFTTTGEHFTIGTGMHETRFVSGVKGYLSRNEHTPNYYQIVAPLDGKPGVVAGWYLKESEVDRLCEITIPAPRFAKPGKHWSAWWQSRKF